MALQTSYVTTHPVAFAGMKADSTDDQIESFFSAESGTTEIPFGVMLKQGSGDHTCNLLTAITNKLVGVAIHDHATSYGTSGGVLPTNAVNVMSRGRVWVTVEDAVTPASGVYVRAVVAGAEVKGAFRGTADSTDTILLHGARFITSAAEGGLAMLEIDIDAHNAAVSAITVATA